MRSNMNSRVHWFAGQTLLPEHLVAQEEALLSEIEIRQSLSPLPSYGVATMELVEEGLAHGAISFAELTVIFPDGRLCTTTGNAVITGFDLEQTGESACDLYVHRLEHLETLPEVKVLEIDRVRVRLLLSAEKFSDGAASSLQIARFERGLTGEWTLSNKFIPPLIRIGRSPFLLPELTLIKNLLQGFQATLEPQTSDSFLSASSAFGVRRTLVEAQRLMALVANLQHEVQTHPYFLLEGLRAFYLELCSLHGINPRYGNRPYDHEHLGELIGHLLQVLEDQLAHIGKKSIHHLFSRDDGLFIREPLPEGLRGAGEVYLIVQRPDVRAPVSLDGIKISHRVRLPLVHRQALTGIHITKVEQLPFQHSFAHEVDFYQVRQDEEWDMALDEGNVAFYTTPEIEGIRASLYWR
jgi:predicted component of type VI protein secretion system